MARAPTIRGYIKDIVGFSPRIGPGELATYEYLKKRLNDAKVPFVDQVVDITVPLTKKVELVADGESIDCRGVGRESGVIEGKDHLISSLMWGNDDFYHPANINFDPRCEKTVSMATFFKHTAIAINKYDLSKILAATDVRGEVVVEPYNFQSHNLLVGNLTNPKTIVFTHYDCWETGAIDNASGTATVLDVVITEPRLLRENLFVITGNEEISYDEPIFWGKGYRRFQEEHESLMEGAKRLLVVDCVGYSETHLDTGENLCNAFPINNYERFRAKTALLCGSWDFLIGICYSAADDLSNFTDEYIEQARARLVAELSG
ncbi:MAG: hypothetical protein N2691_02875 [Patescibacteria group bacterium]|nr:hypothetical protein [Patescibacteria group bacterium]